MVNPIEIRTLSGIKLDVYPNATIEVNMGGISLLNLQGRTATYTNSFKLPRTPVNESVFAFASQPTRNNRPSVNVIITKGLFQRQAVLKVLNFDKDYNCSVSYVNNFIEDSKNTQIDDIITEGTISIPYDTQEEVLAILFDDDAVDLDYFTLKTNTNRVTNQYSSTGNSAIKLSKLLSLFGTAKGYIFDGDLLSDLDFQDTVFVLPNFGYEIELIAGFYYPKKVKIYDRNLSFNDVLKPILHLFLAEIKIEENTIYLNKISTSNKNDIEGFSNVEKNLYTGLANLNRVNYKNSGIDKNFAGDTILAEGNGDNIMLEINSKVPLTDSLGNYITNDNSNDIIFFVIRSKALDTASIYVSATTLISTSAEMYRAYILSLSGFYSNILNPIFANPVILEASRYIDPLTADNIMNTRVINSVQLGGRYWVDTMAYNLTTGQSKLTLIKLP